MTTPVAPDFTVLVIEDNPGDRALIRHHLERRLASVIEAGTLTDGANLVPQADVILLDLSLPDAPGGVETVEACSKIAGPTPIVVVTGHGDRELGALCVAAGAVDFLHKAAVADGDELYRRLAVVVAARRTVRERGKGEGNG